MRIWLRFELGSGFKVSLWVMFRFRFRVASGMVEGEWEVMGSWLGLGFCLRLRVG